MLRMQPRDGTSEETPRLDFVALAAHELRTPATAVYGVLETLAERWRELDAGARDELLARGVEQGERLRRLLEELLDLSRLEAGALGVEPREVALGPALAEIAGSVLATSEGVAIDVPDGLVATVDPTVLERVVSNLVVNASRHGVPPIRVEARLEEGQLRVAVEDAGPGVPPELEETLFDSFARGGDSAGHGLGLAIARAYARAHGGDLTYVPREAGARFELSIPQQTRESEPVATS